MSVQDSMPAALVPSLEVAVPLWISRLRPFPAERRLEMAREDGQEIASHGDALQFRSGKAATAKAFNALARGLAVAAFQPGGVTFAGTHWCADHAACEAAEAKAA